MDDGYNTLSTGLTSGMAMEYDRHRGEDAGSGPTELAIANQEPTINRYQ